MKWRNIGVCIVAAVGVFVLSNNSIAQVKTFVSGSALHSPVYEYKVGETVYWPGMEEDKAKALTEEERTQFEESMQQYDKEVYGKNEETILKVKNESSSPAERILDTALEYTDKIPYTAGGREYGLGHKKYTSDITGDTKAEGLDGQGYVLWLIRQCFGYTPDCLKGGIATSHLQKIEKSELMVGDLCVKRESSGVQYGLVAGAVNLKLVVTTCTANRTENFSSGCSHFCYIDDGYFGNYAPVAYQEYYRLPDVNWEE